jgi:D-alanyl-D-alanine-carboxypeptidase/D-alanyl-D-alanine-endopeptidase
VGDTQVTLARPLLQGYAGRYQMARGAILEVTLQNDQLMARLANQSAFPVFASARDKFFYRVVDAKLDFERAPDGKITTVVLRQNGVDHRATKVAP